jgi:hypothetical protein
MHMSCPTRPSVGPQPASNSTTAHQPYPARQPKPTPHGVVNPCGTVESHNGCSGHKPLVRVWRTTTLC